MWTDYLNIVIMAMLLRMHYELSRREDIAWDDSASNLVSNGRTEDTAWLIRQLADKSVRGYAQAQEKKWRNWAQSLAK